MNQDNDIQNFMGGLSEKISVFFDKNHDIAFLVFIGVFVFLLIGNILNLKVGLGIIGLIFWDQLRIVFGMQLYWLL